MFTFSIFRDQNQRDSMSTLVYWPCMPCLINVTTVLREYKWYIPAVEVESKREMRWVENWLMMGSRLGLRQSRFLQKKIFPGSLGSLFRRFLCHFPGFTTYNYSRGLTGLFLGRRILIVEDKFYKSSGYPRVLYDYIPGSNPGKTKISEVHFQNICSSRTTLWKIRISKFAKCSKTSPSPSPIFYLNQRRH